MMMAVINENFPHTLSWGVPTLPQETGIVVATPIVATHIGVIGVMQALYRTQGLPAHLYAHWPKKYQKDKDMRNDSCVSNKRDLKQD